MASPPPKQHSRAGGTSEASAPSALSTETSGNIAPQVPGDDLIRPITTLPTGIAPEYLDLLINDAVDAAEHLLYDHEDLLQSHEDLERERYCSLSPELSPSIFEPRPNHQELAIGSSATVGLLKRKREEAELQDPTTPRAKPKKAPKNLGRQRRRMEAKRANREKHGWCASALVRRRIAAMVSSKEVEFNMTEQVIGGTQLGGYRPRVRKMEQEVEDMMKREKSAYDGTSDTPAEDVLSDLMAMGYRMVDWDGFNPVLLTDTEERVIGALGGQPVDPRWGKKCMELHDLMVKDQERMESLPKRNHLHRRGKYITIGAGVTFAPGDRKAHNLYLTKQETSFDLFAPRLYRYYITQMKKLIEHPHYHHLEHGNPYLKLTDPEPEGFASHAENQPPSAFTVPHRDMMNLSFGWCAVFALGRFDPIRGGHLVLHDLNLIIPFPHGSLILIPSAFLWHSNVPIEKGDSRASITFFSSSGLFRFIDNDFKTEKDYVSSLDQEDRELHLVDKKNRAKIGMSLYSRLEEIQHPERAQLDPVIF